MISSLEKIYHLLPVFAQNIAISFYGLYWRNRRFGGIFEKEYNKSLDRQFFTTDQWSKYQNNELRSLLVHTWKTVPYYRNLFQEIGLNGKDIFAFSLSDLKKLPILEKQTFRKFDDTDMLSSDLEPNGIFLHSSGSTGTPVNVYYSKSMHQKYFGIYENVINNWSGVSHKSSRGMIGGRKIIKNSLERGPFYRYNMAEKQVYFSAYHISKKTVHNYVEGMWKYGVEYMTGYASSNYFLARFIEESGLKAPQLKAVLTSSEKLTQEMRDTFKRVYGCDTFDSYNGVDLCNLVSECEFHRLHIIPDVGIVELLDENGNDVLPGEIGRVISTGLLNYNQPLIRYAIGDYMRLSKNQSCPCGRNMLIVDEIMGRFEDTVIASDGREMMRFHSIFLNIKSIIEAQVIQHELNKFQILLNISKPLENPELQLIRDRMLAQLGDIILDIKIVDSIPRGANGKFKSVISYVERKC